MGLHKFGDAMSCLGENPLVDWRFALFCFTIALGLVILVNAFFYVKLVMSDESNFSGGESRLFNRKDFDDVLEVLEEKNTNMQNIPRSATLDPYNQTRKVSETPE
jgi:hypothetical protein